MWKNKKTITIVLSLLGFLILVRLGLPAVCKYLINQALQTKLENYTGSIEDFDLKIIHSSYKIQGLKLFKKAGDNKEPFVKLDEALIQLDWSFLFKGEIVGTVYLNQVRVLFVDSKDKSSDQFGNEEKAQHWKEVLDSIVPLTISNLYVTNANFIFQNVNLKSFKNHSLLIEKAKVENIISYQGKDALIAAKGILNNHANIEFGGTANIAQVNPKFDFDLKVTNFDLTTVNELLRFYVPLDVTKGDLTIYSEIKGTKEKGKAYARVFFEDLDVYTIDQKLFSVEHALFEFVGSFANWILSNISSNKVALEIPLDWSKDNVDVKTGAAFWSSIENVFDSLEKDFKNL